MQCLVLEVFSIFPIIGSWAASVTGSWAAWVLLLHCMRTTLDEALAFPLPLRWSPLSWPSGHPMETKHQPGKLGLDPRRALEDPPRPLPLGSSWALFSCNLDLSRLSLHSCENVWVGAGSPERLFRAFQITMTTR